MARKLLCTQVRHWRKAQWDGHRVALLYRRIVTVGNEELEAVIAAARRVSERHDVLRSVIRHDEVHVAMRSTPIVVCDGNDEISVARARTLDVEDARPVIVIRNGTGSEAEVWLVGHHGLMDGACMDLWCAEVLAATHNESLPPSPSAGYPSSVELRARQMRSEAYWHANLPRWVTGTADLGPTHGMPWLGCRLTIAGGELPSVVEVIAAYMRCLSRVSGDEVPVIETTVDLRRRGDRAMSIYSNDSFLVAKDLDVESVQTGLRTAIVHGWFDRFALLNALGQEGASCVSGSANLRRDESLRLQSTLVGQPKKAGMDGMPDPTKPPWEPPWIHSLMFGRVGYGGIDITMMTTLAFDELIGCRSFTEQVLDSIKEGTDRE